MDTSIASKKKKKTLEKHSCSQTTIYGVKLRAFFFLGLSPKPRDYHFPRILLCPASFYPFIFFLVDMSAVLCPIIILVNKVQEFHLYLLYPET